jgi:hypothetical protein
VAANANAGVRTDRRSEEKDMKKFRTIRGLGELSGNPARTLSRVTAAYEIPDADLNPGNGEAALFTLKMHVDNPGQTPM